MKSVLCYGVVITACYILGHAAAFAGDSCFTAAGAGVCRQLAKCESLWREVQQGINRDLRMRLQELACGFEGNHPLVCCADKIITDPSITNIDETLTTSTRAPTTEVPVRGGSSSGADSGSLQPPDVSGHRNLRLLNDRCGSIDQDRIVGGNRTRLFEMPWMVLIAYNSPRGVKLSCAGTLISARYVLTAAHCVTALSSRLTLAGVVVGEYDIRTDPDCERIEGEQFCAPSVRNVTIDRVIPHPEYSTSKMYNDIALIRLAEPADFTLDSMKPICLPTSTTLQRQVLEGRRATVAGWGTTEDGLQSPVLLSVDLPVISNDQCQAIYNGNPRIHPQQLCAGGEPERDSCGGDSGGPLLYPGAVAGGGLRYVQRGVVSYGSKRCGVGGYPGVYTRVAFFMDWILDNITE